MINHLRANLLLLLFTLVICSGLYPAVLWIIGQTVFTNQAQGSLIDKNGVPTTVEKDAIGSRLIAQPFTGDDYFQPRPSAASYNAAASGASNWGANNYLLRDRVARQLGPIVKHASGARKGQLVGPDIEKWFQQDKYQGKPGILAQWVSLHAGLAESWLKSTADAVKGQWKKDGKQPEQTDAFLAQWAQDLPVLHQEWQADWQKQNQDKTPSTSELASGFLELFGKTYPGEWLIVDEYETMTREKRKKLSRTRESSEIQSVFFDMWRQDHPTVHLEQVPADMVMASGSGLDPHITLKNALYQLERVAAKWAEKTKREPAQVRSEIEALLHERAAAPLGGLVGVELVNVLEVNLALRQRLTR